MPEQSDTKFEGIVPEGMVAAMLVTVDKGQWLAYAMLSTRTEAVGDMYTVGIVYGPESHLRLEKFRSPIQFRVTDQGTISVSPQEKKLTEVASHPYVCFPAGDGYSLMVAHTGRHISLTPELKAEMIRHLLHVNR